jgi:glycosyltransferase involved in cell wall biosynthesis
MRIIVEGWRFIPHSFAIANQFQLLEMLERPNLEVFHKEAPYLDEHWQPVTGLLDETDEAALREIPSPPPNSSAEVTLRISVPYNFAPSTTKRTCVFLTTEWGILHNEALRLTGASSLREAHLNSDILILTPSEWSKVGIMRSGAEPSRVVVVPLGVDTRIYKPAPDAEREALRQKLGWEGFIFLNVGAGTPNKGLDLLLKAFAAVVEQYPQSRLVLKGEESVYESESLIVELVNELTFSDAEKVLPRLTYIGQTLSFAEMAQLYQAADAYVSPYLAEGFNMPVLEAIACGLPAICTKGGATDDFTNETFALHIESQLKELTLKSGQAAFSLVPDCEHLIALMKMVIEKPEFRMQARHAGPNFVAAEFTWKHVVDRLLDVLVPPR